MIGFVICRLGFVMITLLFYVSLGIALGVIAALRQNRLTDQVISITSLPFIGLPEFVTESLFG